MPAYHSKLNNGEIDFPESCGCALVKFEPNKVNPDDIIGETFAFFRANVFFRNFPVTTSVDRTLIYMTLYLQQCLVKCEKITGNRLAFKKVKKTSIFDIPYYVTDNSKVKKIHKWKPSRNIDKILNDIYIWLIKNKYLKNYFK